VVAATLAGAALKPHGRRPGDCACAAGVDRGRAGQRPAAYGRRLPEKESGTLDGGSFQIAVSVRATVRGFPSGSLSCRCVAVYYLEGGAGDGV